MDTQSNARLVSERKVTHYNATNLLDILDLPIIKLSYPELKVLEVNEKVRAETDINVGISGIHASELIGKNINEVMNNPLWDKNSVHFKEMESTRKSVNIKDYKIQFLDRVNYFNILYQPIFNVENKISEILVIAMDVTAYMQNKIQYEKLLQTQEEFFSYIAHEFKTPLTVTYSALQLLDYFCNEELSDRAKRFINKIRQSSLQQLRLVNNLLDITKGASGYLKLNKKTHDIVFMTQAIINSVLIICKEKGIDIVFASMVKTNIILIDDEKFERILLNILSNAIKFTPSSNKIYVDVFEDNGYIKICVKDEGSGIPIDKQEIIFDKFGQVNNGLTRTSEGTGIGLCLAKMLARALGGDITLKSEFGKGSEFTIWIPAIAGIITDIDKQIHEALEDRLVQSVNVEFSSIYQ